MWLTISNNIASVRSHLHDLGECEVKHDVRVHVVNFYTDEPGNQAVPAKFRQIKVTGRRSRAWIVAVLIIVAVLAAAAGFYISSHRSGLKAPPAAMAPAPIAIPE